MTVGGNLFVVEDNDLERMEGCWSDEGSSGFAETVEFVFQVHIFGHGGPLGEEEHRPTNLEEEKTRSLVWISVLPPEQTAYLYLGGPDH